MQMCSNLRERPKIKILNRHENDEVTSVAVTTAVCAGIFKLSISMGNQLSTDYSGTVGPILLNLSASPRDLKFDFDLIMKKSPL